MNLPLFSLSLHILIIILMIYLGSVNSFRYIYLLICVFVSANLSHLLSNLLAFDQKGSFLAQKGDILLFVSILSIIVLILNKFDKQNHLF